jgi:hypothetical protein
MGSYGLGFWGLMGRLDEEGEWRCDVGEGALFKALDPEPENKHNTKT